MGTSHDSAISHLYKGVLDSVSWQRMSYALFLTDPEKPVGFFIIYTYAICFGTNPDPTVSIFKQGDAAIIADGSGVIGIVAEDFKLVTIIAVQSIFGGKPQKAFSVLQNVKYITLGEAMGIV